MKEYTIDESVDAVDLASVLLSRLNNGERLTKEEEERANELDLDINELRSIVEGMYHDKQIQRDESYKLTY